MQASHKERQQLGTKCPVAPDDESHFSSKHHTEHPNSWKSSVIWRLERKVGENGSQAGPEHNVNFGANEYGMASPASKASMVVSSDC